MYQAEHEEMASAHNGYGHTNRELAAILGYDYEPLSGCPDCYAPDGEYSPLCPTCVEAMAEGERLAAEHAAAQAEYLAAAAARSHFVYENVPF